MHFEKKKIKNKKRRRRRTTTTTKQVDGTSAETNCKALAWVARGKNRSIANGLRHMSCMLHICYIINRFLAHRLAGLRILSCSLYYNVARNCFHGPTNRETKEVEVLL